jgi:uncharacterized protein (TIGR00251 family)
MKITVKAKPGAKEEKIEKEAENVLKVSVKEPPVQGRANRAIQKVLADYFKVPFTQVRLVSGFASRTKVFEI